MMIEKSDYVSRKLRNLQSEFRDSWTNFGVKAERATSRMRKTQADVKYLSVLSGSSPGAKLLLASNARAREHLAGRMIKGLRELRATEYNMDWLHVTILLDRWTTGDSNPNIDLAQITREGTSILAPMARHWSAAIELQSFSNRRHASGGYLLSPHIHAVAWGKVIADRAFAYAEEFSPLMPVSSPGIKAIKVQQIRGTVVDLARVTQYPHLGPDRRKTIYQHPQTGRVNLHESEKSDRFITYLRNFQLLSCIRQRDLLFAGGNGIDLQNRALVKVVRQHRARNSAFDELISSRDVRAFWRRFLPRSRWGSRFQEPRITRPKALPEVE